MNNISHELALIVCKQTERLENESDVDFLKRLYSVYQTCENIISDIIYNENTDRINTSVESSLSMNK